MLYSLRAGISLISGKKTKAQPFIDKIKSAEKEWKDQNELYKQKYVENLKQGEEEEFNLRWDSASVFKIIGWLIVFILAISALVIGVIFAFNTLKIKNEKEVVEWIFAIIVVLIFFHKLLFFILKWTIINPFIFFILSIEDYKKKKTMVKNISYHENQMQQYELMIGQLKPKYEPIINKNKKEVAVYANEANILYKALQKTYGKFLDVRDWENVDLLIFYLETGRADSMKEGLQLVDRQRQADAIVQAINQASEQICKTINTRMEQLESGIAKCFSFVSKQLDLIEKEMLTSMQLQASANNAQLESLHSLQIEMNKLKNNSELQRAQAAEWQKSSLNMMENVNYIMKKEHGLF